MRLVSVVTSTRSPVRDALANLVQQIVHLALHRADLHRRIDQSGRPDDLLHHHARRLRQLVRARASPRHRPAD